jgi:hypothetical protein
MLRAVIINILGITNIIIDIINIAMDITDIAIDIINIINIADIIVEISRYV